MKALLLREVGKIKVEEIEITLKQTDPMKAPWPDGMSGLFFFKFWYIVGKDVSQMSMQFFLVRYNAS